MRHFRAQMGRAALPTAEADLMMQNRALHIRMCGRRLGLFPAAFVAGLAFSASALAARWVLGHVFRLVGELLSALS